jgi:hypothetical protein
MNYTYRDAYFVATMDDVLGHHQSLDFVTLFIKQPSSTIFDEITSGAELSYIEEDLYNVKIPANLLTTAGQFLIKFMIYEDDLKQTLWSTKYAGVDVAESPVRNTLPPNTCLLVGNVKDVAGRPPSWQGVEVSYRPYTFPQVQQSSAITSETISTVTNLEGGFEMPVTRGTKIVFEIPRCGVRCQYDVPYDLDVINMIDVFNSIINS